MRRFPAASFCVCALLCLTGPAGAQSDTPADPKTDSETAQEAPVAGSVIMGIEVNVLGVEAKGYRASKLIGYKILNEEDELVGTVDDLIVATDGTVTLAILSVGGFLGIGDKKIAVPAELFRAQGNKITLPGATKQRVKELPEFNYTSQ